LQQIQAPVGRERAAAVGLVVAAAVSPQVGAAFAVTLFDELGPAGAAFPRLAFAAIVLWAIWRPRLVGDLRLAGAFGVALGLMNWSFYEAIGRLPLGFALAAAVCWMAYIHLSKRTGAAFAGGSGLALAMAVGALIVLPAGVIQAEGALAAPDLLGAAFVVALASSVLPYSLELEALRRLPEAVFGVLMSLDPAVAALVGFVVLDQGLGARELLAIAMVVVASAGAAGLAQR
jgi:inner membrane transporter RhtA